ncbi:MAG TPA: hypothetical protein VLE94_22330 [Burkholderiaceae bacterium]|nr:hypothetical protein [Burkholderiaceae bacterium]
MRAARSCALALSLVACAVHAQDRVYRCGASYSQEPCTSGSAIAVDDTRSAAQVAQARRVAQLDARLADAMRRERLQAEQAALRQGPALIGKATRHGADAPRAQRPMPRRAKAEPVTLYRTPDAR